MTERVKTLITELELSPSAFADRIGVPRSTISHILSGRNKPSLELCQKILDAFPVVRTEWLVRGRGNMFDTQQNLFAAGHEKRSSAGDFTEGKAENPMVKQGYGILGNEIVPGERYRESEPQDSRAGLDKGNDSENVTQNDPGSKPTDGLSQDIQGKSTYSPTGMDYPGQAAYSQADQKAPGPTGLSGKQSDKRGQGRISKVITLYDDGSFVEYQPASSRGIQGS